VTGISFYTQNATIFGIGTHYDNDRPSQQAINCPDNKCITDRYNFEEDEYIRRIEIFGDDLFGIGQINVVTNQRLIEKVSDAGDKRIMEVIDLFTSERVIGFSIKSRLSCVDMKYNETE